MAKSEIRIPLQQFKTVTRRFRDHKVKKRPERAVIAFRDGYASFETESGEVVAVHADGTWDGMATIPAYYLAVLYETPPREDPVIIRYEDGKLSVSTLSVGCKWESVGAKGIKAAESPSVLDLLALDRTVSRAEVHGTSLGKKISQAKRIASAAVTRAATSLAHFGIAREEIETMVEQRIRDRIARG